MNDRIRRDHLERDAVVYVRQSSAGQVRAHTESTRLQIGLRDKARTLGWLQPNVICDDLGVSAGGFAERAGFQKLVADVSLRHVGIILCFEASRLSRNSRDWAQLFELCGHLDTLVADLDQIYDLSIANDRLLLGIKGSVSEYELALLRQRSAEAIDAKAQRGELQFALPAGLSWTDGQIELVAERRIQQAVRMVFDKFDELGSARQVLMWLRDENLTLPSAGFPGTGAVRWCKPTYRLVLSMVRSPLYAGAYAYGRSGVRTRVVDGRPKQSRANKPMNEWKVLIVDNHEGYISWDRFLRNQRVLAENAFMTRTRGRKSARGGGLLLAGLLRCARCGHMLHVAYGRYDNGRYECRQMNKARAAPRCIGFGARPIDQAVRDAILTAVQDEALDAALEAAAMVEERAEQQQQAASLELEQARYEAQLAQRRYEVVDPQQRLVAAELEARWNTALERVAELEQQLEASHAVSEQPRTVDRQLLNALAHDLEAVWQATDATALKQRIVRILIEEIVADIDDDKAEVVLMVHWVGGRHTELKVARTRVGEHGNSTSKDADALVRTMAGQWPDGEIAATLNRLGLRTGVGNTWTAARVLSVRKRLRLVGHDPAHAKPMLTLNRAADKLGVGPWVIRRLIKLGVLEAIQPFPRAPWKIELTSLDDERVRQVAAAIRARKIRPGSKASSQLKLTIIDT
jgi:DNA invertase Pin-like site-specific DNA recombinase